MTALQTHHRVRRLMASGDYAAALEALETGAESADPSLRVMRINALRALGRRDEAVTLRGDEHRSRVGASLLTSLGHPEWVTGSPEEYVETALRLATDETPLRHLRHSLRKELQRSPLSDLSTFRPKFDSTLRGLWRRWCEAPR